MAVGNSSRRIRRSILRGGWRNSIWCFRGAEFRLTKGLAHAKKSFMMQSNFIVPTVTVMSRRKGRTALVLLSAQRKSSSWMSCYNIMDSHLQGFYFVFLQLHSNVLKSPGIIQYGLADAHQCPFAKEPFALGQYHIAVAGSHTSTLICPLVSLPKFFELVSNLPHLPPQSDAPRCRGTMHPSPNESPYAGA